MKTNVWRSVLHGAASVILFAIPFLIATHSPYLDLTVGGLLNGLYHWAISEN